MWPLPDVAIGAILGLCGVFVAQLVAMIQSRLDRQHQRRVLLRTKYEEFANHVTDSFVELRDTLTAHRFLASNMQPLAARRAYALSLLYFPLLRDAAHDYLQSLTNLYMAQIENFQANQTESQSDPETSAAYAQVRAARVNLDDAIRRHAHNYVAA